MKMLKKRIPTVLGIFLLLVGITAGVYLVELGAQPLTTRAGPEIKPSDVRITNVSDVSFTVSWYTEAPALGFISYGTQKNKLNLSALDDRDSSSGGDRLHSNHYVTVSDLSQKTTYYFEVVSGSESSAVDDGQLYSITTAPAVETTTAADTAYGAVYYSSLSPAEGTLTYVTIQGGALLSSLAQASGNWAVPLSSMRSTDLSSYFDYDKEEAVLSIEAVGPDGTVATALTTTGNDAPVDDIILGEAHDFRSKAPEDGEEIVGPESQFTFDTFESTPSAQTDSVTLANPVEGELINTQTPEFIGDGPPGKTIEITLDSETPLEATVFVDNSGNWSWTPDAPLEPGEHTLTLKWTDNQDIVRTLIRRFTVFAQGESDLPSFEATPSATATPTQEPGLSPTPTPTTAFPSPSPAASPTAIPILTPTTTPTPVATQPVIPQPGTGVYTIWFVLAGLILTVSGSALLLKKQLI